MRSSTLRTAMSPLQTPASLYPFPHRPRCCKDIKLVRRGTASEEPSMAWPKAITTHEGRIMSEHKRRPVARRTVEQIVEEVRRGQQWNAPSRLQSNWRQRWTSRVRSGAMCTEYLADRFKQNGRSRLGRNTSFSAPRNRRQRRCLIAVQGPGKSTIPSPRRPNHRNHRCCADECCFGRDDLVG
jgi:hypothetical protein